MKMKTTQTIKSKTLRAVGYCRTSGEGQRDNTSIPDQKKAIEKFINSQDGWYWICHYEDESKSGGKIDGRFAFQRMIKDAADNQFDVVVIDALSRFGRDVVDILSTAKHLKKNYQIYVVDTIGTFDNRTHTKDLTNLIFSGFSEQQRRDTLRLCMRGRKSRAKEGRKWCNAVPFGRSWDKEKKKFIIDDNGYKLQKLLPRYVNGESLKKLAVEYGFKSGQTITRAIRESQLSGTYYAIFNAPDVDIINEKIAVPNMPEIITPELEKRVRNRMAFNKRNNKQNKKKYALGGFVRCAHCGGALKPQLQSSGKSQNKILYYRHYYKTYYANDRDKQNKCPYFRSIRADILKNSVLDYLYNWFVDKPAFEQAVKNVMPDDNDRRALQKDIERAEKQIKKLDKAELNLVNALSSGMKKTDVIVNEQNRIIAQRQVLNDRLNELSQTYRNMPDFESIKHDAELLRWSLLSKHWGKDWRKLPYEDIRQFLHFLFSDNPRKNGYGIFVGREVGQWIITFKGQVEFSHDIVDGQPEFLSKLSQKEIGRLTAKMKDKRAVAQKAVEYQKIKSEAETLEKLIGEAEKHGKQLKNERSLNIIPKQANSSRT